MLEHGANVNAAPNNSNSPLQLAITIKNKDMIDYLLTHKANVNVQPDGNASPLQLAVLQNDEELVELLISHGADLNTLTEGGLKGYLRLAIDANNENMIKLLLKNGADINARHDDQESVLELARCTPLQSISQIVLNHHANNNGLLFDSETNRSTSQ